jgi:aminopeptidase
MVAEEAYDAGAKNVMLFYTDELASLSRFQHASDEAIAYAPAWFHEVLAAQFEKGVAYLSVFGSNPALLRSIDSKKVAIAGKSRAEAAATFSKAITRSLSQWGIVGHASPGWAQEVFPGLSQDDAVSKLWEAIFACTYVDEDDPVAAWNEHSASLERRRALLNARGYTALHFKGPGTDLRVGLAEGHQFQGGRVKSRNGFVFSPNIPTEEVFTMPHKDRVDGTVRSTKPLSVRGSMIDGIQMSFKDGKAVEVTAEEGNQVLQGLLNTDEGARRLGEVALVPNSSAVSKTNVLFLNTLYDENAACHIAVGQAIAENLRDYDAMSEEERAAKGMNSSLIHIDWMIGSAEVDVDGLRPDGGSEPLMRQGEWVETREETS